MVCISSKRLYDALDSSYTVAAAGKPHARFQRLWVLAVSGQAPQWASWSTSTLLCSRSSGGLSFWLTSLLMRRDGRLHLRETSFPALSSIHILLWRKLYFLLFFKWVWVNLSPLYGQYRKKVYELECVLRVNELRMNFPLASNGTTFPADFRLASALIIHLLAPTDWSAARTSVFSQTSGKPLWEWLFCHTGRLIHACILPYRSPTPVCTRRRS